MEQGAFRVFAGSAVITVIMLFTWVTSRSGWTDGWQVAIPAVWTLGCLVLWLGISGQWFAWHRLAPRSRRDTHEHPKSRTYCGRTGSSSPVPPENCRTHSLTSCK